MGYKDPQKQREYNKAWIAKRRADWLREHGPCIRCGSDQDLEIDHIDPSKKVSHNIWSWSDERREVELAKCQVLCNACHLQKTIAERPKADHGSSRKYQNGCRCDACKAYNNARRARQRGRLV